MCSSGNGTLARRERLLGEPDEHDRVLAAAEQQRGLLALGRDLAHHVDGLGLERAQVRERGLVMAVSHVQPALGLGQAGPAALAAGAGCGARRAADRRVALVVQRVVRQVALVDPPPQVLLGPVEERVVLPDPALVVELDRLRVRARGRLLAADAGDPGVGAGQRALERGDLARRRSSAPAPVQSPVASSISTSTPKRSSNARQVASVSGNSTPVSIVTIRASGASRTSSSTRTDSSFWKEQSITRRGWWRSTACASTSVTFMPRLLDRRQLLRPPLGLGAAREVAERLAVGVVVLVEGEDPQQRLVELPVRDLLDHDVAELAGSRPGGRRCGCPSPRRTRRRPS